jgi:hypothetical protein
VVSLVVNSMSPCRKKQKTAGDFGSNTVELKQGSTCFNGAATDGAARYRSATSQAAILTYSVWSAFSTVEMEALITELCVHGKYYYAKTKVHRDGKGATHGQMTWRVDELFRLDAENPALEIPKIRKFLGLIVEEAALRGCTPCFFRSIIRIYCPRAGAGHQHHDKGVRGARLVSQCSFQRAAEHELQFFISS